MERNGVKGKEIRRDYLRRYLEHGRQSSLPHHADGEIDAISARCDDQPFGLAIQLCTGYREKQHRKGAYFEIQTANVVL